MENRKELEIRSLTPAQLYAVELQARRHRSEEMGRLFAAAMLAVKNYFTPARTREVHHA